MVKIIITEQQFKRLIENDINELSSDLLSRAAQEAFDNDDDRVRKFRYGTVDSLSKEDPSFENYPKERNKDAEFLQKNRNAKIKSFDSDYNTLEDLYNGVKQGKLLIHCRGMQGEETLRRIYPEIGDTVREFYGDYIDNDEYSYDVVQELVFASDDFNWARGSRDAVYFVYSDDFVRSLADGRVQTPNGEIYYNNNLSASVESGDWFSSEPADVAAVLLMNKDEINESKEHLHEHKSISQDVVDISKHIINFIVSDAVKEKPSYSEKTGLKFKENDITCTLSKFDMEDIHIYYLIYFIDNASDIRWLQKHYDLNCSYDEETREMKIITYVVIDTFAEDFEESVIHETTHMFQYDKGMEKRKNLYDNCIELYQSSNTLESYVGLLLYHTFPHEQDAFVHQFYQHLFDLNLDINDTTDYNAIICNHSRYGELLKFKNIILKNLNNEDVLQAITNLGFNRITFKKRLLFSFSRFKKKLKNACEEYYIQKRKPTVESSMRRMLKNYDILLSEGYRIEDYSKLFKTERTLIVPNSNVFH